MLLDKIILNICDYEYEYFLMKANVQGVGLGYKIIKGCATLEKSILVFVSKKLNKDCLSKDNLVPTNYKGIKTDVIETGVFTVDNNFKSPSNGLRSRVRPVTGGYSVGPAKFRSSATYGGLVTDGQKYYMLGNNHSLANSNSLLYGYPILQPAVGDGGRIQYDMIAKLSKFIPLKPENFYEFPKNYVDCAIAEVLTPGTVSPNITFIGKPTGKVAPTLGLEVQCACRTSAYITGKISAIGVTQYTFNLELGTLLFKNQIIVDYPAKGGDSGGLFMTFDNKVVGMIMSGAKTHTTCNPIDPILDNLNVTLVL